MGVRVIPIEIDNEYVKGAEVPAGAAGSHHDVVLEITFNPMWDNLAKKITWLNAKGENPAITILTADMLLPGTTNMYCVPIPAEPKEFAGDMVMTVKGAVANGETEQRATVSARCTFRILQADFDDTADLEGDITPTQATQLQSQIDNILGTIQDARAAATEAADSAANAENSAQESNDYSKLSESYAHGNTGVRSGENVDNSMYYSQQAAAKKLEAEQARDAAVEAKNDAVTAKGLAETAKSEAVTAKGLAETARDEANAAKQNAEAARDAAHTSEENASAAKTDAETAKDAAVTAKDTATAQATLAKSYAVGGTASRAGEDTDNSEWYYSKAKAEKEAAEAAKNGAETAERLSESWTHGGTGARDGEDTDNAEYWCNQANLAAGGGVSSFNGRNGAVVPQTGDYTPAQVGADPAGAADAVQSNLEAHTTNKNNPHNVTIGQIGAAHKGTELSVTLTTGGWADNTQTVANTALAVSGYSYVIAPAPDSLVDYGKCGIYAQDITAAGQITFKCKKVPTAAISVNILKLEVE